MRIRMYLRGLGIGIVVTALIMGLTSNRKQTLTDEEIKAKAVALGMVEQDSVLKPVISEENSVSEPTKAPEPTAEPTKEIEPTKEPTKEPEPTQEPTKAPEPTQEPTKEPEPTQEPTKEIEPAETGVKTSGVFTVEIAGGTGSETVCALLEKGGAVASASDFDKYLCDHGYDHKIRAGKHVIPAGADYETIAKIITGR